MAPAVRVLASLLHSEMQLKPVPILRMPLVPFPLYEKRAKELVVSEYRWRQLCCRRPLGGVGIATASCPTCAEMHCVRNPSPVGTGPPAASSNNQIAPLSQFGPKVWHFVAHKDSVPPSRNQLTVTP